MYAQGHGLWVNPRRGPGRNCETMRTRAPKSALSAPIVILVATLAGGACSNNDAGLPPASCTGAGCTCGEANSCACTAGTDCKTTCGAAGCAVRCDTGAKCNAMSEGPTMLTCNDSSECKGTGGDGSVISCVATSKCELKAGAHSSATCSTTASCKLNLGAASSVTCADGSSCDVKCAGDCAVTCGALASCKVTCTPDDTAATKCPDGRLVCGHC